MLVTRVLFLMLLLLVFAFNLGSFYFSPRPIPPPQFEKPRRTSTLQPCVTPETGRPSKPETHCGSERLRTLFKSQSEEDRILQTHFFPDLVYGKFLEMGGLDGVTFSNSFLFEQGLGWDGLLVEADPRNFPLIQYNRPRAMVVQAAVCEEGRIVHWTYNSAHLAIQGIWEFMNPAFKANHHPNFNVETQGLPVKCRSLRGLLEEAGITHLDFFSLDVEGAELAVMQTFPWDQVTLSVLFFEAEGGNLEKETALHELLLENGGVYVGLRSRSKWYYFPTWLELGLPAPHF